MKKAIKLVMVLAMVLCMNSCSDKENDEPATVTATEIAADYTGTMKCTAMGQELVFDDVDVELKSESQSKVEVIVTSFGNPPMKIAELRIPDVTVSGTPGHIILSATEFSGTSEDGKNYSGTIQGSFTDNLTLEMELSYGNMPFAMICSYEGSRQ